MGYHCLPTAIDYDEAYNLQVVDMLSKGEGYASYGALKGLGPWLFDPNITTGPLILGPLALLWKISGESLFIARIFMVSFAWLYVAGLLLLLKTNKSGLMLSALAVGSSLCITNLQVGKILGELPAAAVIVWAAVAVSKNRPLWAAILAGAAIQIKLVYGLAGLTILTLYYATRLLSNERTKLKTAFLAYTLLVLPTALFEMYRFITFSDLTSYLFSIDELRSFLRTQNINNTQTWASANALGSKVLGLYQSLPIAAWLATSLAILLIISGSTLQVAPTNGTINAEPKPPREMETQDKSHFTGVALTGLIIAGVGMAFGWITQSVQLGARQALPFLLLSMPPLFVLGGLHYLRLRSRLRSTSWSASALLILFLFIAFIFVAQLNNLKTAFGKDSNTELSKEQIRIAQIIKREKPESIFVDGWWQNPEFQLLSGVPGIPFRTGNKQLMIIQDYQASISGRTMDSLKQNCNKIIYASSQAILCWLPNFTYKRADLRVLDWGPQNTQAGVTPNEQPDSGAGIVIRINKINIEDTGPIRVYVSGRPSYIDYLPPNGDTVIASIPPRHFKKPGKHIVELRQAATGETIKVGYFLVH